MKRFYAFSLFICCIAAAHAQEGPAGFKQWFKNNIKVSQSTQTVDLSEQPAQLQLTFPKKDTASYLINAGIAVILNSNTTANFISSINIEYHRNTLTDAAQNNFSAGYGYKWRLLTGSYADAFMTGDLQYVYDGVNIANSLAGTFLFTLYRDGEKLNWNSNNFRMNNRMLFNLSPFAGVQAQDIFKAANPGSKGFILRPLFTANTELAYCRKEGPPFNKILSLFCNYTGRIDVVNSTGIRENYTQLLKTGLNYYLAYTPFAVSLSASFNYGSDPLHGLRQQQFWLISLNFLK